MLIRIRRGVICGLVVVCVGSGAAVAAGSPPKNVAPAKWAKSVCTAIGTWNSQLAQASTLVPHPDAAGTKAALSSYLGDAITTTNAVTKALKAAGTPKVTNGAAIAKVFVSAFGDAAKGLTGAVGTVAALPTGDATAFTTAAAGVESQIQGVLTAATTKVGGLPKRYDSSALDRAFDAEPACQLDSTGMTATTTPAATQPTCDAASLLAAAKSKDANIASVDSFKCGNGWAGAGVEIKTTGGPTIAAVDLFKAQGTTWVVADRAQSCNDPSIPADVHFYCTVS